jgi:hypothetical protein
MYVIVFTEDDQSVLANAKGTPRHFPKAKKARNFVQGRPRLRDLKWRVVDDLPENIKPLRVDL